MFCNGGRNFPRAIPGTESVDVRLSTREPGKGSNLETFSTVCLTTVYGVVREVTGTQIVQQNGGWLTGSFVTKIMSYNKGGRR